MDWNTGKGVFRPMERKKKVTNSVNSIQLNTILDGMMAKLNEFILDLVKNNQQFDFEKLNAFWKSQPVLIRSLSLYVQG